MIDYEKQGEAVKALIDEAAFMHWDGENSRNKLAAMKREHGRATREMVDLAESMGRCRGKRAGIERAISILAGIGIRDVREAVGCRALDLFGEYAGAAR